MPDDTPTFRPPRYPSLPAPRSSWAPSPPPPPSDDVDTWIPPRGES